MKSSGLPENEFTAGSFFHPGEVDVVAELAVVALAAGTAQVERAWLCHDGWQA